jgi:hypothetical protein
MKRSLRKVKCRRMALVVVVVAPVVVGEGLYGALS